MPVQAPAACCAAAVPGSTPPAVTERPRRRPGPGTAAARSAASLPRLRCTPAGRGRGFAGQGHHEPASGEAHHRPRQDPPQSPEQRGVHRVFLRERRERPEKRLGTGGVVYPYPGVCVQTEFLGLQTRDQPAATSPRRPHLPQNIQCENRLFPQQCPFNGLQAIQLRCSKRHRPT